MENENVTLTAAKDLAKYLQEEGMVQNGFEKDKWFVSVKNVFSKNSKFLNSLISIDGVKLTGINKTSNNNNMKR